MSIYKDPELEFAPDVPFEATNTRLLHSIAVSLKRIADNSEDIHNRLGEIKDGVAFMCKRWSER